MRKKEINRFFKIIIPLILIYGKRFKNVRNKPLKQFAQEPITYGSIIRGMGWEQKIACRNDKYM